MPSDLQVDNIKDASATKTLATLSSSAVTLHSDVTFPAGISLQTFQSDKQQTNQINGDQNAITCTLNTTAGTTSLKNSNSKLVIFFQANLVKRNATSSAYLDAYLAGGNLGSTTSGIPARLRWGEGFGDNANCGHGYAMGFDAPASTTPTYNIYISTSSASLNWQFYNAYFTFWEIKV